MVDAAAVNVVANPLANPITAQVETKLVEMKEVSYHFRRDKELGDKSKRATFKMAVPLLTVAGLIAALQANDKATELVVEQANIAVIDRLRGLINDKIESDTFDKETNKWGIELTPDMFDLNQLSFLNIALLPKSERGAGIAKEAWAAFVADYKATMVKPEAIAQFPDKKPRDPAVLEKHGVILGGKFNAVRSRKDVLNQMQGFLDIWATVSENVEEHMACYEHLKAKAAALLQAENFDDL